MKVLAIEMTPKYCKGLHYELSDDEAIKGIQNGIFQNVSLNAVIDNQQENQETYNSDGSDKTEAIDEMSIIPTMSKTIKPKKK